MGESDFSIVKDCMIQRMGHRTAVLPAYGGLEKPGTGAQVVSSLASTHAHVMLAQLSLLEHKV